MCQINAKYQIKESTTYRTQLAWSQRMVGVNVAQAQLQSTDQEPLIHLQRGRAGSGDSQGQRSLAGYSP